MTTGRLRRCGWFDAVIARYASRVNGITDFFLTKLDVLSSLEQVPICVAYDVDGRAIRRDAAHPNRFPPLPAGVRDAARLVRGHLRLPARSTNCRPTRRPTCAGWRSCPGRGSPPSASGRAATRRSCVHDVLDEAAG